MDVANRLPLDGRFQTVAYRLAGLAGALLNWRPDDFWHATPEELGCVLAALSSRDDADAPPDAAALKQLMEQFPDG